MNDQLPIYEVEELTLEEAVLMLATDEEKQTTDYRKTSYQLIEKFAAWLLNNPFQTVLVRTVLKTGNPVQGSIYSSVLQRSWYEWTELD